MQPVQKLAEPHSVASNGANAINDARIINHDEEHGADLAPTDDLYGVLRTIGIDVADLLNALGRLHTRVRRLATRHAPSHALLARAGRPFRGKVLADNRQFIAKLEKQKCPLPAKVADAVTKLLDALKALAKVVTVCRDGISAGTPSGAVARPRGREGADRHRRTPTPPGGGFPRIDLGYLPVVIHDRSMWIVGRLVYTRILKSLSTCSSSSVRYNGRRVATKSQSEERRRAIADRLTIAFIRSVYPRACATHRTASMTALMEAAPAIASAGERPSRWCHRAMSGPSALVFDDGALTSLARRRALFPVLQAIGVNIPRLTHLLFRSRERVLLLKERRARIYEMQAVAGRRFLRRVEAACRQFKACLAQQGLKVPEDVHDATSTLFDALEVPVNHLTDRFEGGPTDAAALAHDRTQANYAAERRRLAPHAAIQHRIAPGAATGAVQQRFMPIVRCTVHREIESCLKSYEGPALEFEGRRIVNMIDSEVAAPASADVLTAAFVQTLFPLWGATTTPEVVRKSRSYHRPSSR